ncbi:putative Leucine Rich repeat [Trypanosoma vivax]|uniref:Leucine-rich repeat protein (LRRP) n=1 Tax=Trypanosoma vivax (strain Y486) TaxID=1055687 RepID=G0U0F4_TRYVY|nr:hypothetical protein TRVL_04591 [Trypanosoma vivax]KAH8610776.1 putative Leucine Rich repeat [Trypanosoma vivax]CCC49552.1 conserved hypothetical protein [Trypanosoma vivax Y486]
MWEETYTRACANRGLKPREEVLSATDGVVECYGNSFENFNNRLTDDEAAAIGAACAQLPLISVVCLPYNIITSRGAAALADAMQQGFNTLQHLDLSYNSIEGEGAVALAEAAAKHSALATLLLSGNAIGGIPGPSLKSLLESQVSQLVKLDLERTDQDMKSLVYLCRGLVHNTTLTTLNLNRPLMTNPMDVSYVVQHLSLALKENRTLQSLSLAHFNITDTDLELLFLTLRNSAVVSLSLKGNKLSQASGEPLAELLNHCPNFVHLDLTANRLRDVGASAIASAVSEHCGLQSLLMGNNTIGGTGLSALARALKLNTSVKALGLWGNDFSEESVADFFAIRKRLESVETIDFSFYVVDGVPMLARE